MRYEILGPLQVIGIDGNAFVTARKIEVLLAALLVRAGQVVSAATLMNEIWGEELPRRATAGLHVYVSQLRKLLGTAGAGHCPVVTRAPGYLLDLGPDELDAQDFLFMMARGRGCAVRQLHEEAVECFSEALLLFRGPVLSDLGGGPLIDGFVTWGTEARLECTEAQIDSSLQIGRHREMIGQLYSLTAEYPLRESFHRQLMLALYRSERRADALRAYQVARSMLSQELGVEPCRALQDLQRAILCSDGCLDLGRERRLATQRRVVTRSFQEQK
jgi:DNA-binding SARP family transcriptional activator